MDEGAASSCCRQPCHTRCDIAMQCNHSAVAPTGWTCDGAENNRQLQSTLLASSYPAASCLVARSLLFPHTPSNCS